MTYVDLAIIHDPTLGQIAPVDWGDQIRDNLQFLANPPSCKVKRGSPQLLPNNVHTAVTWDQEDWDTDVMHDNATNNARLTVKTAGRYAVWGVLDMESPTGTRFETLIKKNGSDLSLVERRGDGGAGPASSIYIEDMAAANDFYELWCFHNSAAAVNLHVRSRFGMRWVGL